MPYARARISAISHLPGHPRNRQPSGNPGSRLVVDDGRSRTLLTKGMLRTIGREIRKTKSQPFPGGREGGREKERKKEWKEGKKVAPRRKTLKITSSDGWPRWRRRRDRVIYVGAREDGREGREGKAAQRCVWKVEGGRRVSVEIYRSASYGNLAVAGSNLSLSLSRLELSRFGVVYIGWTVGFAPVYIADRGFRIRG